MEGTDEENLLEKEEENEKEEEKVLPPQKNNLFNYFARKQVSKEKGPPVVEQMSKKGEASISVREETTKSKVSEQEEKCPKKRKRRQNDEEGVSLKENENPRKRKRESKKEDKTISTSVQSDESNKKAEPISGKEDNGHSVEDLAKETPQCTSNNTEEPKGTEKPKGKGISSFFAKVTKEERLANAEKTSSTIEVKAMIHQSPELKEDKEDSRSDIISHGDQTDKKKRVRKPRKSNVAMPESEANGIEVIEVHEEHEEAPENGQDLSGGEEGPRKKMEKEEKPEKLSAAEAGKRLFGGRGRARGEPEIELANVVDVQAPVDKEDEVVVEVDGEADRSSGLAVDSTGNGPCTSRESAKISSKLFGKKNKRGKGREVASESDESVSFESPVKKVEEVDLESIFEIDSIIEKVSEKRLGEDEAKKAPMLEEDPKLAVKISSNLFGGGRKRNRRSEKENANRTANASASPHDQEKGCQKNSHGARAGKNIGKISEAIARHHRCDGDQDLKNVKEAGSPKHTRGTQLEPKRPGSGVKSAFALMMSKAHKCSVEVVNISDEGADDAVEAGLYFPSVLHPEEGIDCDMPLHLVPPLSPMFDAPPREERGPRRNNVIRSDSEDGPLEVIEEPAESRAEVIEEPAESKADVPNNAFTKLMQQRKVVASEAKDLTEEAGTKDAMVTNMLSVLKSVRDNPDADMEEEDERRRRRRERRRQRRSRRATRELSTSSEKNSEDEQNHRAGVKATITEEAVRIQCKQVVGSLYPKRYVSETVGLSVQLDGAWYTPMGFQKFIAPKASKFEVNLFVNDVPIQVFFEQRSRLKENGGDCEENLPLKAFNHGGRKRRMTAKRAIKSDEDGCSKEGEEENEEDKENSKEDLAADVGDENTSNSGSRRSGRIARSANVLQERLKKEEELDRQLKEREKKEKAATKRKNMEIRKAIRERERGEKRKRRASVQSISSNSVSTDQESSSDCEVEKVVVKKNSTKLAAIFLGKKEKEVVKEDPAVTARRKEFLMSSTPEVLRAKVAEAKEREQEEENGAQVVFFPTALNCHVRQDECSDLNMKNCEKNCESVLQLCASSTSSPPCLPPTKPGDLLPQLRFKSEDVETCGVVQVSRLDGSNVLATLEGKADKKKSFPFRRVWESLVKRRVEAESFEEEAREKDLSLAEVEERRIRGNRKRSRRSRGGAPELKYKVDNPSALLWTGKYQPRCGADVVGNRKGIQQLRTWLSGWLGASYRSSANDANTTVSSTDTGSGWGSDGESQDPDVERTTALIKGPPGSGKTAAVFALAAELGFNVLEVNASSGRNGKALLAKLHEATQSQQVRRDQVKAKEESKGKKKALILFEDIDIVFEDLDDGFYGAVSTLVQQTKRPIVMTTSDKGFQMFEHRQLRCDPEVIFWKAPAASEVALHLQALALVEGYSLSTRQLAAMTKTSMSMRQAVLQMQLYCQGNSLVAREEESTDEEGEEVEDEESHLNAPQPDVKKWFRQLESRERRRGKAVPGCALPPPPLAQLQPYDHRIWWGKLPHVERKKKTPKYPLEAPVKGKHRIDPLKCKDLFDEELSEEETEDEIGQHSGTEQEEDNHEPNRETKIQNRKTLKAMVRHLDILSLEGEEGSAVALSACVPLPSEVATVTMWEESGTGNGMEAQDDVLESGLVAHREVMGWREACEMASGVRSMARLEEERRLAATSSGRRGASSRFIHYFSSYCNDYFHENTLLDLCNTFS